jgi:transcription elongation factor Elf1
MSLQSLAPLAFEFRRYLSTPSCPRCGTSVVCPEVSEFVHRGEVRHSWACDSCGEQFQTTVQIIDGTADAAAA